MILKIPDFCLVLLIGPSGCGKSSFAAAHFMPTEVVSSDRARGWVSDDETDQSATPDAFDLVHAVIEKRLKNRRLTVVDATNVQRESRAGLIALARKWHALPVGIAFDMPVTLCVERNRTRPDRPFGEAVVRRQQRDLERSLRHLDREGLRIVHTLRGEAAVAAASIERTPLWVDRRGETGPFDIIGDVHGCCDELELLLARLGYAVAWTEGRCSVTPPPGRKAVFLGDLVDRGPRSPDVLRLVKAMVEAGTAFCVAGNHDEKLKRWLSGRQVKATHGLQQTIDQFALETAEFATEMRAWLDSLVSHYLLDGGRLVVAHAGMKEEMQGRASGAVRSFALYGETTGETDEYGLPVRYAWAEDYKGKAKVVYGHTPVPEAGWLNGTICLDTGCVFGGKLTALRYPELELVQVPAARIYYEHIRPPQTEAPPAPAPRQLDLADVLGRQVIDTRLGGKVTVRAGNAAAALEVMSRFALDPRWLIYLPPTMSPVETSRREGWLERPEECFAYYRREGLDELVLEEKHMGSRGVVVLARDAAVAARRFGIEDGTQAAIYTRTGRRFFTDPALEQAVVRRLAEAMESSGLWDELATDWVAWDCEILPWNLKAQGLIRDQYAPVGAAAAALFDAAAPLLAQGGARGLALAALEARVAERRRQVSDYRAAFARYLWPCESIADVRIAPFHLLASERQVHGDKPHAWHMDQCHRLAAADPALLLATAFRQVRLDDEAAEATAVTWWEALTAAGGEGLVFKPSTYVATGRRGLTQPAIKCRGREYLRIIYGPDYDAPENLERLRSRSLARKRALALWEFKLGLEALSRFVEHAPLTRVHQAVFGVLAMESEPVDPRL